MRGPAALALCLLPASTARELSPSPLIVGRWGLCVVLAADYRAGSALRYGEAAVLIVQRSLAGFVHWMVVDLEASRQGGRELWNVPKELAEFIWDGEPPWAVQVRDGEGRLLLGMRWAPVMRAPALPGGVRFIGGLDGSAVTGTLGGRARLLPRRVRLEIPPDSPLAALRLSRPLLGLAGSVDAHAGGGRPATQPPASHRDPSS